MRTWKKTGDEWGPCENLPLGDRGFRYGMSVFETIAVRDGRPLMLGEHLERLKRAAESCRAGVPPAIDGSAAGGTPALQPFDFSQLGTGLLRFYLTAGEGGLEAPFAGNAYALFDEAEVGWNLPALRAASSASGGATRPSKVKLSIPCKAAFSRTGWGVGCAVVARGGGRRSGAGGSTSASCLGCSGSGEGCASAMCGRASSTGAGSGGRIGAAKAAGGGGAGGGRRPPPAGRPPYATPAARGAGGPAPAAPPPRLAGLRAACGAAAGLRAPGAGRRAGRRRALRTR